MAVTMTTTGAVWRSSFAPNTFDKKNQNKAAKIVINARIISIKEISFR
jgi:hypothetical protein